MANPIRNAIVEITKKQLTTCKRCGCTDLAWVKYASGKWGLVQTAVKRPFWRGEGPAPEGLYALKFNYHKCEEYRAQQAEIANNRALALRAEEIGHPKASQPADILADAMVYLFTTYPADFRDIKSPIFKAAEIIGMAATRVGR